MFGGGKDTQIVPDNLADLGSDNPTANNHHAPTGVSHAPSLSESAKVKLILHNYHLDLVVNFISASAILSLEFCW